MRTCSAQTPTEGGPARAGAFTLVEILVVLALMALLVALAQTNLFGVLRRSSFKAQVQDFISTMQMAVARAAESGQRYEVIINLADQSYLLRELPGSSLTTDVTEEQIVTQGAFGGNCRCVYVQFDDGAYTNEAPAKFRAGHIGWQYGGKVVFLDESEQYYAVIVNRVTPIVQLLEGDPLQMTPKMKEEVPFL